MGVDQNLIRRPKWKVLAAAAGLGALIGWIAFAPIWLRHDGQFMDYGDYYNQYVPFVLELKRMISSGSLAWSWNSFLGDSFISAYSYYTVFNPFAWLVACFPEDLLLYGMLAVTMLKLAVSMASATLFLRRFCSGDVYAVIGALLYTFSGFTNVNTYFYFFLDVIAVFPLLMYGLELLIHEYRRGIYLAALVLNAAINYYFFVSTVILVVLYVFFRLELYRWSSWRANWQSLLRIALYSVIGTGLACFALIPDLASVLHSEKAMGSVSAGVSFLIIPQRILHRLSVLLVPSESGVYRAFYEGGEFASTGAYLPVFGAFCVVQRCIRKRDWLCGLCIALFVIYMIPMLNDAFALFTNPAYTRWLYGLVLVYVLATVQSLESHAEGREPFDRRILLGLTLFTAVLLLFPTLIYILEYFGIRAANRFASICQSPYFMGFAAIGIMWVLTAVNYLLLWWIASAGARRIRVVLCCAAVMSLVNMAVFNELNYDRHEVDSPCSNQYFYEKTMLEGTTEEDLTFRYRIDHPKQVWNYGLYWNLASVNNFNSLQNQGSTGFALATGIAEYRTDVVLVTPDDGGLYTDALLSVKYYYDYNCDGAVPQGFVYAKTVNQVDIYENENYLPMGFTYDTFCTEAELAALSPAQRAGVMLSALVVDEKDAGLAAQYLRHEAAPDPEPELRSQVAERRKNGVSYFEGTSEGFSARIELDQEEIVFFSIPSDAGWEIRVNGSPAQTLRVNYGLLGICCQRGANEITAVYHPVGVVPGLVCSACFLLVLAAVEVCGRKRQKGILI